MPVWDDDKVSSLNLSCSRVPPEDAVSSEKLSADMDLFKIEKFTNCLFKIGDKQIECPKATLARSSPVFEAMFLGNFQSDVVEITDISPEHFQQMLEYIRRKNVKIFNVNNAWELYSAAHKYMLKDLMDFCIDYVVCNLSLNSLALSYEFADIYNEEKLKSLCFDDIIRYFAAVLTSSYHMKATTLNAVLKQKLIVCDKFKLVIWLILWGIDECYLEKLNPDKENVAKILIKRCEISNFLTQNWILNEPCSTCNNCLIKCDCYNPQVISTAFYLKEYLPLNENDNFTYDNIFLMYFHKVQHRKELKMAVRVDLFPSEEFVTYLTPSSKIKIFGVKIKSLMNPGHNDDLKYNGKICVSIAQNRSNLTKITSISDVFTYDDETYVPLDDFFELEQGKLYELRISYENFDFSYRNSVHCYYMSNVVKINNTALVFHEIEGGIVKGIAFYPVD